MEPTFLLTLDLELAWGTVDLPAAQQDLEAARWTHDEGIPWLLRNLEAHGVRATWAAVGALLEDGLPAAARFTEVDASRPWFGPVPVERGEADAPEWFAPSLVRRILEVTPPQELGFHGYSHVLLGDRRTPRARVVEELAACRAVAQRWGVPGASFVFPRNVVGHLDELRSHGFRCYRAADERQWAIAGPPVTRLAAVAADFVGAAPPLVRPRAEDGLAAIPGSVAVRHFGGWRKWIPDRARAHRLRAGLERVVEQGGLLHVWGHPINLYVGRPRLANILGPFLEMIGAHVAAGRVRNVTMSELAREILEPR